MQPTPDVTIDDLKRIVRRDFDSVVSQSRLIEIDKVDVTEKTRVVPACLKNASGDMKELLSKLDNAQGYWRDTISVAEYPLASKKWSRMQRMSVDEKQQIYDKDWEQYQAWLTAT